MCVYGMPLLGMFGGVGEGRRRGGVDSVVVDNLECGLTPPQVFYFRASG